MMNLNQIKTKEEFDREVSENKNVMRAIRLKCYDCSAMQLGEVKECPVSGCPLYPFRLGKNPFRTKREMSDEEKEVLRERLCNARKGV